MYYYMRLGIYLTFCIHCRGFWVLHNTKLVEMTDIYAVFTASFLKNDPNSKKGGSKFLKNTDNHDSGKAQ
jgi:hypothetical protein